MSNNAAFSLCVFCGARLGAETIYAEAAVATGRWIGKHGGQLVYGGGRGGLMGIVADAALASGARVIGIIPKALVEKEWADEGCTELHVVETMHDRKRMMAEKADAFVALPGGIGTLEEFFEVWTWRQLHYHDKPVGLLNTGGYYDGLMQFMQTAVDQQFLGDWQLGLVHIAKQAEVLLPELIQSAGLTCADRLDQV